MKTPWQGYQDHRVYSKAYLWLQAETAGLVLLPCLCNISCDISSYSYPLPPSYPYGINPESQGPLKHALFSSLQLLGICVFDSLF